MRFAYSGIGSRPHPRGPRPAEGVGRGVSGSAPGGQPAPHAVLRAARGGRRPARGLRRLGDAGAVPDRHPRRAPGHAQPRRPLRRVAHGPLRAARPRRAPRFLQHVLTNNAEALDLLQAQYTIVPTPTGGAVDDAYLYRFVEGEFLLVVNAANRVKDWEHFERHLEGFPDVDLTDETGEIAMLALQGQASRDILAGLIEHGSLPDPFRNELSVATLKVPDPSGGPARHVPVRLARTGLHGRAPLLRALPATGGRAGRLGRARRGRRHARRAGRPRHPASRGRPAAVRPRARPRPRGPRDPRHELPAGHLRGQLLAAQGRLRRARRRSRRSTRPTPASWRATTRDIARPAAPHTAGGRDRARHRPRGLHRADARTASSSAG